jgi:hypothetical protein
LAVGDLNFANPVVNSLIAIPDDPHDTVWLIVKRTIKGKQVQYVEFFEDLYESAPFRPFNEIQTLAITATGGTFTLKFDNLTTAAIGYDITAASLKTALELLDSINEVSVSGGPGGTADLKITFIGDDSEKNRSLMVLSAASLTGGSATITETQEGEPPKHPHFVDSGVIKHGIGINEVQTLTVDATGGTLTISHEGETSGNFDFDATAAELKGICESFPTINEVEVTGGPGAAGGATPYIIVFKGNDRHKDMPAITADGDNLTGGAGTATVTETTKGVSIKAKTVDGLEHLEGEQVQIIVDGAAHPDKIVSDGSITLDKAAGVVHVGLHYTSKIHTMPLEFSGGGLPGRLKTMVQSVVNLHESLGGKIADLLSTEFDPFVYRDSEMLQDTVPPVFTGMKDANVSYESSRLPQVVIKTSDPLPFTVLSLSTAMEVSREI